MEPEELSTRSGMSFAEASTKMEREFSASITYERLEMTSGFRRVSRVTNVSSRLSRSGQRNVVMAAGSATRPCSPHQTATQSANASVYVSATSLRAVAPAGSPGKVKVTVTTPSRTSKVNMSYTYDPAPTVISVIPDSGPVAGGTQVTVEGSGFLRGETTVEIGESTTNAVRAVDVDVLSPPRSN